MTSISQTLRYLPHDLNTKFYSVQLYRQTKSISHVCRRYHISKASLMRWNKLFDGTKNTPYVPSDKTNTINAYGLSKLHGEQAVEENCDRYYILRTSWLYGHHGKNFVETMISLADNPEVKVVNDQIGCPTWTVDLADTIISFIDEDPEYGIYHACGGGSTTWYDFAKEIYNQAGLNVNLKPCTTEEFPRQAKRPKYSIMDNDGLLRDWKLALKEYLELRVD